MSQDQVLYFRVPTKYVSTALLVRKIGVETRKRFGIISTISTDRDCPSVKELIKLIA